MGRRWRFLGVAVCLAVIWPAAAAAQSGEERRAPRILLSDFGPGDGPSRTLVEALRAHEERRRDPAARLQQAAPDPDWARIILEQAEALEG